MLDMEDKTQTSKKRPRNDEQEDFEYVSKYFVKKRKLDDDLEGGVLLGHPLVDNEVIDLISIDDYPDLESDVDDVNSDWTVTEIDSSDLDEVALDRMNLSSLPPKNTSYGRVYPVSEYYSYYVKRYNAFLEKCKIVNQIFGCQAHQVRYMTGRSYKQRTLKLQNGKMLTLINSPCLVGVVKYHLVPPLGYEISHLCGTGDCVRQSHIVYESKRRNSLRKYCSACCICVCKTTPFCKFPHIRSLTGNETLKELRSTSLPISEPKFLLMLFFFASVRAPSSSD